MKRKILCVAAAMLCFPQAAYAAESASSRYKYNFETGADIEYARHTPTSQMGRDTLTENIRRDKDVQVMPPPYFYGDGVFATAVSNPMSLLCRRITIGKLFRQITVKFMTRWEPA